LARLRTVSTVVSFGEAYRYASLPSIPVLSIAFGRQGEGRSYLKAFFTGDQKILMLSGKK